jgi:hypothetical protein
MSKIVASHLLSKERGAAKLLWRGYRQGKVSMQDTSRMTSLNASLCDVQTRYRLC